MSYKIVAHHRESDGIVTEALTWADSVEELNSKIRSLMGDFSLEEIHVTTEGGKGIDFIGRGYTEAVLSECARRTCEEDG